VTLVDINGVKLACEEAGEGGPPFLFVHGFACDRRVWAPQFRDLSRDHRCVSVDLRGRGESPAAFPCDIVTAADDLAALCSALNLGPAIVVGHSLGGLVALALNHRAPTAVLGLVTGDSPMGNPPAPGRNSRMGAAISEAGSMEPARPLVESFFAPETPAAVQELVRDMMFGCPPDVAAGMLDNDALEGQWDAMLREADQKPFMAIWADRPLGNPNRLREITVFLRQEPMAGAGHFFQLERPDVTTALLRAFLDDVARDPRIAAGTA